MCWYDYGRSHYSHRKCSRAHNVSQCLNILVKKYFLIKIVEPSLRVFYVPFATCYIVLRFSLLMYSKWGRVLKISQLYRLFILYV